MNQHQRLPIWRDSQRLLLEIEIIVRQFSRYHKYTIGTELRTEALQLCKGLARALAVQGAERVQKIDTLLESIADLKILIQLAKELQAYHNFKSFQSLSELIVSIGKQGGAWKRHLLSATARSEFR